jgi:hypothetical protein
LTGSPLSWRGWAVRASLGAALAACALPTWNLLADPFQVFQTPLLSADGPTLNERFRKVDHLMRNPAKHDAFLLGTSAMGAVEPSLADTRFPGRRFYNLSMFAAQPGEILAALRALKAAGVPVKAVVYGLEPGPFHVGRADGPATRAHYAAMGASRWRFGFDYLFASSPAEGLRRLAEQFKPVPSIRYDIAGTGRYHLDAYERAIQADHARFVREKLRGIQAPPFAGGWIGRHFEDFGRLLTWLRAEGIEYTVYLNPLHPALRGMCGGARLAEFARKIREAGKLDSLPDCSRILDGNVERMFYDLRHFRPAAGEGIFACVFGPQETMARH